MKGQWNDKIFNVLAANFNELALEIFHFQYAGNKVYRQYVDSLNRASLPQHPVQIPFLPIRFFKSHQVITGSFEPELVFTSSGTSKTSQSHHLLKDVDLYRRSFTNGFEAFYGKASEFCILGLLPSYLERSGSSLVFMVNELVGQSGHPASGFYLDDFEKLSKTLLELEKQRQKTLLIGVTFALLDFADYFSKTCKTALQHISIMETGGMKGRGEELVRPRLHGILREAFGVRVIQSEYGMTELLSQAYSMKDGLFRFPPWAQMLIREEDDPLTVCAPAGNHYSGAVNIIDLANLHSCSFIATDDAGKLYSDGSFEVLGRLDHSDLRGCSLMTL